MTHTRGTQTDGAGGAKLLPKEHGRAMTHTRGTQTDGLGGAKLSPKEHGRAMTHTRGTQTDNHVVTMSSRSSEQFSQFRQDFRQGDGCSDEGKHWQQGGGDQDGEPLRVEWNDQHFIDVAVSGGDVGQ